MDSYFLNNAALFILFWYVLYSYISQNKEFFNCIDVKWYKYCRPYSIVSITEYEGSL